MKLRQIPQSYYAEMVIGAEVNRESAECLSDCRHITCCTESVCSAFWQGRKTPAMKVGCVTETDSQTPHTAETCICNFV